MRQLQVLNVYKSYNVNGRTLNVLKNVNFDVRRGEVLTILGPSQCGKSTLCKVISGIEKPSFGRVLFEGYELQHPVTNIALSFHDDDLFPWLTIRENVEFGLLMKKFPKRARDVKVNACLRYFELEPYEQCYPKDLPRHVQYKVSLARSLAVNPNLLVLDDPFRSLDESSAERMRKFLDKLHKDTCKTFIITTNNVSRGLNLADEIIILSPMPSTVKVRAELPPKSERDKLGLVSLEDAILKLLEESIEGASDVLLDSALFDDLRMCLIDLWENARRTMAAVSDDYLRGLKIVRMIEEAVEADRKKGKRKNVNQNR
jgi:NitT/TauT family transport system ATP-binding protein